MLQHYKTSNVKGQDSLELDPVSQKLLIRYLELFKDHFRPVLYEKWAIKHPDTTEDPGYLFVPAAKAESPYFADSGWSQYITSIFREKTGMNITVNMLRSSFVTYFYSSDASSNVSLRESMASGMRHSVAQAKATYDRRTAFEKKRKAVDFCGQSTSKFLKGENYRFSASNSSDDDSDSNSDDRVMKNSDKQHSDIQKGPANKVYDANQPFTVPPEMGDFVAVPFKQDGDGQAQFWLGKVLRKIDDNTMLLAWMQQEEDDESCYKMKIGAAWEENIMSMVFPIDVIPDKAKPSCYKLNTPPEDILKAL